MPVPMPVSALISSFFQEIAVSNAETSKSEKTIERKKYL